MVTLPKVNALGFFEIRLESIGGLGANLAGKMLAEAGVNGSGLNGVSFSSYGSEKKGSPVKAHIRFCMPETLIRDTTPVERPHIVGIFHESLHKTTHVTSGIYEDSLVLVNSTKTPEELKEKLRLSGGKIAVVDAIGIALEEKNRVNMAMLGALFRLCDFLDAEQMKSVIRKSLEKKYPNAVQPALNTFQRGYDEVKFRTFAFPEGIDLPEPVRWDTPMLGYDTQPIGGVVVNPGNSILKDLSISRAGMMPHFLSDKCIHCAACDNVCPDYCFVWEEKPDKKGRPQMFLQGIDYQYCKGCLKCVYACPTDALSSEREEDGYADEHRVPHLFDLAVRQ
ncbi:2-oxoacid:acceptor oxidoreductase family protein [Paenibacillus apiarius]|uniref:2-oxoacid:acceptor oxidoreductase family protein n=1 Tax=Paenibacillus apiarius TaxID=46240 RepID=A0ABT4E0M9_9BACL|nr:2-oxoacid:acceptor oxidoreductase family protein [Paenibacillus apiarius]MCY9512873.1 2-oxoacid:acceptor oxidoreductase family protein [Paenibacillus apiarius]MCY9522078.1 2-oxoacid:acceptor oxidoreductase family protein [Paenibacillus apiarius]MCY9554103.1 2-oxoacid:acceptor oxidoreductase family protein [Paenibacillus apiarius]MCY9558838.1 2-oxoacid:acceptor oxidoreductase family protein [Paenibacillus apiarius]MCY9683885.1 2-oxoacid:acceptor oxidoreductase family protein [Paenibacillus a